MSEMKKKYCKECGSETNHIRPSETFMCVGCGKLRHLSSPIEDELQQRITELEAENKKLRHALEVIADSNGHHDHSLTYAQLIEYAKDALDFVSTEQAISTVVEIKESENE